MKRRTLLTTTAAATGAAVMAPAIATQAPRVLKMATSWPRDFPGFGTGAKRFAQRLERASGGRLRIELYPGGELVPALKVHDAVQEGTADLYHSVSYYFVAKHPGYHFFTAVPFGLTGNEMAAWIHHWGGQALWDQVGAEFGIKHLMCGCTGVQMGGWYRNPIRGIDDFKGLKMRLPGLGGEVLRALGGEPVLLAAADIMPALEAGTLDATEWVGPWNDEALGIQRLIKNYHYPGFHEPGTVMDLGISRTLWDSLSDAERALFEACAGSEFEVTFADFNANNGQALGRLLNDHNVVLHAFPVEVYRRLGEVARDLLATLGQDPAAAPIYQSYMDYRVYGVSWSKISEQAYMAGRELVRFHDTRGF